MKLLDLTISNFRGIPALPVAANGHDVNIFGSNGTGKTTTEDAFLELLFGKDSSDRKDYDLIPHKPGTTEPDVGCGKEPTVEATLEYFGKTVKLKKAYLEEWPKKGEMKGQYAGSKMHFYVDDLEVKAGEYQSVVSELVDPDLFKLITNPHHFTGVLSWQERRQTLVKIAGELNVESAPALAELMCGREFDKFYALAKQNAKTTQKELDGIPYAITEAKRLIPAVLPDPQDISALMANKSTLEERLLSLKNDDAANVKRRKIAETETEISQARSRYTAEIEAENSKFRAGIKKLEEELQGKTREFSALNASAQSAEDAIKLLTGKKQCALDEWHEANSRKWTGSDACPTCGQPLPADQVEATKAAFNKQRSKDLERLVSAGTALKNEIAEKQRSMDEATKMAEKIAAEISTLDSRIEKGCSMVKPCNFEATIECADLKAELDNLAAETCNGNLAAIEALAGQIQEVQARIDAAHREKIQAEQAAEQQKHVAELMKRETELNAELGRYEKAVSLCGQHVKAQAKALEQAVNGRFKVARFQMFQMQKNGEEVECCDVVYPNGSTNLSAGEKLQTGIDIINTLTEYYGVTAPIWVDNAEGVTKPYESDSQIIRLIVSKEDEKLRVEVAG
ncbi:MAG: hypothetical protein WCT05_13870 [Lentisphaeria bacterium]